MPDKELALWQLDRMRDSEEFLAVIQKARIAGKADILDEPEYVARHKRNAARLYQSGTDEDVEVPISVAAKIEALMQRDMLSSPEEFIEKALAAYIERHPRGAEGLPREWQSTFDAARAEIEGKTSGAFEPGFVADLAAAARSELDRQARQEQSRSAENDGRGS